MARGEGVYAFSHLTFQEYLAALAVAGRDDYVAYTLRQAADPWWREVILLEAGHLSLQSKERTTRLIRAIADRKEEPEPYHNLVLAAECLRDVGGNPVVGDLEQKCCAGCGLTWRLTCESRSNVVVLAPAGSGSGGRCKEGEFEEKRVVLEVLERRTAAAQALAQTGIGYWTPPYGEPEWVEIPAGEFWMGEGDNLHRVYLDTFAIARVPITNAQYQIFVEATGHEPPRHWGESRPVVNVTWHDALAYCRWLSQATGKRVTLPSEAEWEKAARGDKDKRAYPWGGEFEAARCNGSELGLGGATPVGIFPEGASPYGVLDMAGNVWEWTRSLYREYPYNPQDGREKLDDNELRVLRGGSFDYLLRRARCAARGSDYPVDRWGNGGLRVGVVPVSL